jgi:hypothetical protein
VICGFAEQLEFLESVNRLRIDEVSETATRLLDPLLNQKFRTARPVTKYEIMLVEAATATADFYLNNSCADGIPMWDTGAPNLHRLGDYLNKPTDPFNQFEPVDSSAAAIAAQGLIRLGNYLLKSRNKQQATRYRQAGLAIARTLFGERYLSTDPKHQGLLLHSVYHRPNGWDYIAPGQKVPNGESSMWGDYHARELALLLLREARGENYLTFFDHSRL